MRKTLWLCSVGVLAACAPVYQTRYTLLPPATREGRACANGCLYMNTTCIGNCRQMKLECNWARQSALFYDGYGYRHHLGGTYGMNTPLNGDCSAISCIENCNAAVRACHINCGGTIQATSVCTANCDDPGLPPPPVPPAPGALPLD